MLSENKLLLHLAEILCAGGGALCLGGACFAKLKPALAPALEGIAFLSVAGVILMALVVAMLLNEFSRELLYRRTVTERSNIFASRLLAFILHWSPSYSKHAAMFGAMLLPLSVLIPGAAQGTDIDLFEGRHTAGALTVSCGFFLLLLPVLAAAARMPGAFEDHPSIFGEDER